MPGPVSPPIDVEAAVGPCDVTALPEGRRLRLVWVRPLTVVVASSAAAGADGAGEASSMPLLDAYRVSRVPWTPAA